MVKGKIMGNTITQENLITEPKKKERIIAFDFLRIIAALAVIMIHTSGIPFVNYANSLSRFAVPVFLMISGALMLNENKKITFKDIFKKILFFTLVILFWNVTHAIFFQVIERLYQHQKIYLANIVTTTILGHFHFWYMYLLLGLYLITPILRLFIKKSNIKFINYYVILAITFSFLPDIINVILNKFTPNGIDNIFIDFIDIV